MSRIRAIRCNSAHLDHRLAVGDEETMRVNAKTGPCAPQSGLRAHPLSCPIGAIPAARRTADPIRFAPITHSTHRINSNPHSVVPPLASCQTARGFLPRGLSDAYRRPC